MGLGIDVALLKLEGRLAVDVATLQERMEGFFPSVLGIQYVEASEDGVVAKLPLRSELCTVPGVIHGGVLMAFADTLGAVATIVNLPAGATTTTLESKTNFLRGLRPEGEATGRTVAIHKGRSTMVWQTRITDGEDRLVAQVIQTQMVLMPRA